MAPIEFPSTQRYEDALQYHESTEECVQAVYCAWLFRKGNALRGSLVENTWCRVLILTGSRRCLGN